MGKAFKHLRRGSQNSIIGRDRNEFEGKIKTFVIRDSDDFPPTYSEQDTKAVKMGEKELKSKERQTMGTWH